MPEYWLADVFLAAIDELGDALPAAYAQHLRALAPTDKQKKRPLLVKHLQKYTSRNTMDYFIHKDLGGFLRRELDFYIKNEIMRLDDLDNADAPQVEAYLDKVKVLRRIAHQIIAFLAQLEDFQKKLWLKKKFVTETNYCITLDRVPEELYPEIAANDAQRREWCKLFHIEDIKGDANSQAYSEPLTVDFLRANPFLVLDTAFFDEPFKNRLLSELDDLDAQCDGVLVHSENSQALNLAKKRYTGLVNCIYIDPPYNTGKDGFQYKDGYLHSSWLSLISERMHKARELQTSNSVKYISIDENESAHLRFLAQKTYGPKSHAADLVWNTQHSQQNGLFSTYHEYVQVYTNGPANKIDNFIGGEGEIIAGALKKVSRANPESSFRFPAGVPIEDMKDGEELVGCWGDTEAVRLVSGQFVCEAGRLKYPVTLSAGWTQKDQMEKFFYADSEVSDTKGQKIAGFFFNRKGKLKVKKERQRVTPSSILPEFGTVSKSTDDLKQLFGDVRFERPKPVSMLAYLVKLNTSGNPDETKFIVDYFAGSGTTGHAIINLNREDGGRRKCLLAEVGDYFDTVLKPRLAKVIYSEKWKGGRPVADNGASIDNLYNGISRSFKYIRLESYEDVLNNLSLQGNGPRDEAVENNEDLRREYLLNYFLDVETRGSQSLLNIHPDYVPNSANLRCDSGQGLVLAAALASRGRIARRS